MYIIIDTLKWSNADWFIKLFVSLLGILPFVAFAYVANRLHFTYWQHDRQAHLIVDVLAQCAVYRNHNHMSFALSDVVQITNYESNAGAKTPWKSYGYQVFVLKDGTEIIITCLLYYATSQAELFPAARRETVQRRICWLPTHNS